MPQVLQKYSIDVKFQSLSNAAGRIGLKDPAQSLWKSVRGGFYSKFGNKLSKASSSKQSSWVHKPEPAPKLHQSVGGVDLDSLDRTKKKKK